MWNCNRCDKKLPFTTEPTLIDTPMGVLDLCAECGVEFWEWMRACGRNGKQTQPIDEPPW